MFHGTGLVLAPVLAMYFEMGRNEALFIAILLGVVLLPIALLAGLVYLIVFSVRLLLKK
jgi:hypothetical protein